MANSYYVRTYGQFIKDKQSDDCENRFLNEYARKWNEAVKRLKESGVDLTKIRIVTK